MNPIQNNALKDEKSGKEPHPASAVVANLPSKLELSFPAGAIPKSTAEDYTSLYAEEYMNLSLFLRMKEEDDEKAKLKNDLEEALFSDLISRTSANFGPLRVSWRSGFNSAIFETLMSIVPPGLRSWVEKTSITSCGDDKQEKETLGALLGKSAWGFSTSAAAEVIPLFGITVYNMFTAQDFHFKSCSQIGINGTGDATDFNSFDEACTAGSFPMNMFSKNFPSRPVASMYNPNAICPGIASGISSPSSTYTDWQYVNQYCIYAILMLVAVTLSNFEDHEKLLTRVSLGLGGVFLPSSDTNLKSSTVTAKTEIAHFLSNFLCGCVGNKRAGAIIRWIPKWFCACQYTARIVEGLCMWYLFTLFYFPEQLQDWYVFPTIETEEFFFDLTVDDAYDADIATKYGWCSSLTHPVKVTFVKYSSESFSSSALQALLFLQMCYSLIDTQAIIYNWVDTDEMMDATNKDDCPYYDMHLKRHRVFTEPMLYDWLVVNFQYAILHKIMTAPEYGHVRKHFEDTEQTTIIEGALKSIHEKHEKNPKGGWPKEDGGTHL